VTKTLEHTSHVFWAGVCLARAQHSREQNFFHPGTSFPHPEQAAHSCLRAAYPHSREQFFCVMVAGWNTTPQAHVTAASLLTVLAHDFEQNTWSLLRGLNTAAHVAHVFGCVSFMHDREQ
jgi:hypothetical protein